MRDVVIVDSVRTGLAKSFRGSFNLTRPDDQVAHCIDALLARNGEINRTSVGGELAEFYGREVTGLDGNGRMVFAGDTDGDGDDRNVIGSPHPDFTYGLNLNLGYKGFDLAAFFNGSQGNDIYNYNKVFTEFGLFFNGNRSTAVLDAWTPSNTNTDVPALSASYPLEETAPNSYLVEDGSFFRLRNLQLGYMLPDSVTQTLGTDSIRIFVQGTNLFTITNYTGYDPEIIQGNNLNLGVDRRIYPFSKTFTVGTNIKF